MIQKSLITNGGGRGLSIHEFGRIAKKVSEKSRKEHMQRARLKFDSYTPLNSSRERILMKCVNTEFKETKIRNSYMVKESFQTNSPKYFCFHKIHGHNMNDCI